MDQSKTRKRLSREEKLRDQKIEEEVMKVIDDGKSPEEKLQLLIKHCIDRERSNRRLIVDLKYQFKQLENVERERDNLQKDCSRNVLMRDKLTEVCREQQKIIKSLKNESTQKIREEEERRKELQSKFNECLGEITQSLTKNNEENVKLQALNLEMNKKLQTLFEQYNVREQQLEKLGEQMQLESQLHQAKVNKLQVESVMEREVLMKEKELALEELLNAQKMVKEMFEREASLKEQLNMYTEKYDDIKDALRKSNDVFVKYKRDMEELAKYIRKLEKDGSEWRRKWQQSNATIISLATEKVEHDEQSVLHNRQIEQLRKLLRALQNERVHLYGVLKEHNIDVPPVPPVPGTDPEAEVETLPIATQCSTDSNAAGSSMNRKNYVELKKTLAYLQQQMKQLSNQPAEIEEAVENSSVRSVCGGGITSNCKAAAMKKMKKKDKKKVTTSPSSSIYVSNGDVKGTDEGDQKNNNTIGLENNGDESKKKCKRSKIKTKTKSNLTNGTCCEESLASALVDDESNLSDNDMISSKIEENQYAVGEVNLNENEELLENILLPLDPLGDNEKLVVLDIKEIQSEETQLEEISLEKAVLKETEKTELQQEMQFAATIAQKVDVLTANLAHSCLEENCSLNEEMQTLEMKENLDPESKLKMSSIEIANAT